MLALATTVWPARRALTPEALAEHGLTLVGLVGLIDPPRPEAQAAIAQCRGAGIRVIMITGDHATTARAIAAQLGLSERPSVLTGQALEAMDDTALQQAVR